MSSITSAAHSGATPAVPCAHADVACGISVFTADGWNGAAASYLATNPAANSALTTALPRLFSAIPTTALGVIASASTDAPKVLSLAFDQVSVLSGTQQQVVSSYLAQVLSLQTAAPAPSSGATSAANGTDSGSGGKLSSGAAARGDQPTEVAFMAMAGIVAGVAGVVVGL